MDYATARINAAKSTHEVIIEYNYYDVPDNKYNVLSHNCAMFVHGTLGAGGLETPPLPLLTRPNSYMNQLQQIYQNSSSTMPDNYPTEEKIKNNAAQFQFEIPAGG